MASKKAKLGVSTMKLAKPEDGEYVVWDTELKGFGLRVRPSGKRTWFVQKRVNQKERKFTIGDTSLFGPDAARRKAGEILQSIAAGNDPAVERAEAKRKAATVADLLDMWMEDHVKPSCGARTIDEYRSKIDLHLTPHIGKIAVTSLSNSDVKSMMQKMSSRPTTANRAYEALRACFRWAGEFEHIDPDSVDRPFRSVKRNRLRQRKAYIKAAELALILAAIDEHEKPGDAAKSGCDAIKVLALSGARRDEIRTACWRHFYGDRIVLTEHKTDEYDDERTILLTAAASEIIERRRKPEAGRDDPIFAGRDRLASRRLPVSKQYIQKLWRRILSTAVENGFTRLAEIEERWGSLHIHDLRHSFASIGLASDLNLAQIGELLGHRNAATTARYAHLLEEAKLQAHATVSDAINAAITKSGG
jgi:integrase